MVVRRIGINPEVLQFHITNSRIPVEMIKSKETNIELFLAGEKDPTFNQISTIAKLIKVPTGLLLLNRIVETEVNELKFRTMDSDVIDEFSPELRDSIKEMQVKQDFLREEIENELDFIGKFSVSDDYMEVVRAIRGYLNLPINFYEETQQAEFAYLRERINALGVFVFLNGKVKDNSHRPLDSNEFRGFVLSDNKAPIIFINQLDSKYGKKFTLLHELVHLFVDENEIFTLIETKDYHYSPVEYFVNKVTAEILVPKEEIMKIRELNVPNLSEKFKVSEFVIARRLYDFKFITKNEYEILVKRLKSEWKRIKTVKKSRGGNYHNNLRFRTDKSFINYVENAINDNRISYTEAFSILGVGYKGYKSLVGGIE
ncbi:peptidase [Enterococcus sp. JM4C]|uniref:ImmA/IrrE family metallo-endopeptidase n=1 Tax=Candidatus Enterococcus huntleyi TaxID=1857217 RepID=UPI00137A585C|nr:ImmA/IrrE family metallo-endopeptidase [Enterococcus sp. JM4C]KAF1299567.1 peptidase [Enterococcus sp. JM4C]